MNMNELIQDNEFKDAIEKAGSPEEIAQLLQAKGFEVSSAEIEKIFNPEPGEINENELETVTGGGLLSSIWQYISALRYKAGGGGFSSGGGGKGALGGGGIAHGGGR